MKLQHETKQKRIWVFEAFDPEGNLRWREEVANLTVNEGLDEILDKFWKGSAYTAQHYLGLTDGTPTFAAGDTMSSHAGWTEVTGYSEASRPDLTASLGAVSSQQVDNSGSAVSFSINAGVTVGGGFITTDNTKSGTTGILIGGAAFSGGDRSLQSGDTLNLTVTITEASA